MKRFTSILPVMLVAVGLRVFLKPENASANPDFTKRTSKKCVYCHVGAWTSGQFTEAGQYFKVHNTLKGYAPKEPAPPQGSNAAAKDKTRPKP